MSRTFHLQCFSGSVAHQRWGLAGLYNKAAEDGGVPLRQWVYALGTEQFVCSLPVVLWILLGKRESSVAGGPFVFHVTLSLIQQGQVLYKAVFKLQAVEI